MTINADNLTPAEQQHLFVRLAKILYGRQDPLDIREGITPHDVLLFDALTEQERSNLREHLRMIKYSLDCIDQAIVKRAPFKGIKEPVEERIQRYQQAWEQMIAEATVEYAEAEEAQAEKDSNTPATTH